MGMDTTMQSLATANDHSRHGGRGAASGTRKNTIPSWQRHNYNSAAKKIAGGFSYPTPINAYEPYGKVEYDERGRMGDWGRHQIVHEEGARRLLGTFSAFTPLAVGDPYDEKKPTANGRVRGKQLIAYKFNGNDGENPAMRKLMGTFNAPTPLTVGTPWIPKDSNLGPRFKGMQMGTANSGWDGDPPPPLPLSVGIPYTRKIPGDSLYAANSLMSSFAPKDSRYSGTQMGVAAKVWTCLPPEAKASGPNMGHERSGSSSRLSGVSRRH